MVNRDRIGFSIRAAHAGYVYVHMLSSNGSDFIQLFPNALDKANRIAAGQVLTLPRGSWGFLQASGPAGTDHFVAIVSDAPRDFGAAGLAPGNPFPAFSLARAAALQAAYTGTTPLFAGVPDCGAPPCPALYGAAAFSVDEFDK
jgi:hypothetical protein